MSRDIQHVICPQETDLCAQEILLSRCPDRELLNLSSQLRRLSVQGRWRLCVYLRLALEATSVSHVF